MKTLLLIFLLSLLPSVTMAKIVEYNIDIKYENVNFTGKEIQAMTVGGSIPGQTLEFDEGDLLKVTFNNKMDVNTSIHWHGLLLPNDQDGVPYINTLPIYPGKSHTFTFPIIQSGTYWYHSHTNLQEQRGVYGAIVIHPKKETLKYDRELVVVLSDWTDENPDQVFRNLKKDGDYYALKKDNVQSLYKVIKYGAYSKWFRQNWSRMGPMDLSDVGYDLFLINGKPKEHFDEIRKGERIRLRIINASASTYYNMGFAGGQMEIVSADGLNVKPLKVDQMLIAVAETYDVIVTIPEDKSYEFRATAQDGTGYSSAILGKGEVVQAKDIPKPNPLLMEMMHENNMMHDDKEGSEKSGMKDHSKMKMKQKMKAMDSMHMPDKVKYEYSMLSAVEKNKLPETNPTRTITLNLTGNMERYIWSFNGKTLSESDMILIKKGENVKFVFVNKTMMHHPLHLHGHFFRVLNGKGEYAPLKHTVDVKPMGTLEIEFLANEEKDWFFHCHNLYHMMAGMDRVLHYEGTERDQELIEAAKNDPDMHDSDWYYKGEIGIYSNMAEGMLMPSNTRNIIEVEFDSDYDDEYDLDVSYARSFTRFFEIFAGGNFEDADDEESDEKVIYGFRYVLPLLIETEVRFDPDGYDKVTFSSEIQLTDRTQLNWQYDTYDEYRFVLEYRAKKSLSVAVNYDSEYQLGGGLKFRF